MDKLISVIIPTYHDWDRLQKCLDALASQNLPKGKFEIILVNNDPTNKAPDTLQLPANAKIIAEPKKGSYAARNTGIKKSNGKILAFTDSDCVPDECWLEHGLAFFDKNAQPVIMAGRIKLTFQNQNNLRAAEFFEREYAFRQQKNVTNGVSVTANMMSYRKVFDRIGLFNETLFSGGDFEWSRRATRAGVDLEYADDVKIFHPARTSIAAIWKKAVRVYKGTYEVEKYDEEGFLFDLLYGLYLLRPRFKMIRDLSEKYPPATLIKIMSIKFIYDFAQMLTHYQLVLYGGRCGSTKSES